ncbi:MAG: hypothetical protein LBP79_03570 [Clostridiales bacterium]|jgi:hypothetical protein|nr:hypothetical protein [Clostridiales bacterium]
MKTIRKNKSRHAGFFAVLLVGVLIVCGIAALMSPYADGVAYAEDNAFTNAASSSAKEIDYTFEEVPVEVVTLNAGGITQIQPRQNFNISYSLEPFWTTTTNVFYDVFPEGAASVADGIVTVSPDAVVGSVFTVTATADDSENITSESLEFLVEKIPVAGLTLAPDGTDSLLHIGKTRKVVADVQPAFATNKTVRYEISGTAWSMWNHSIRRRERSPQREISRR